MKQKFTTATLFQEIKKQLAAEGKLPDILDYAIPPHEHQEILRDEFECIGKVSFGGSEGIYLDMYLDGLTGQDEDRAQVHFGTLKTLRDDYEAYKTMCVLMADIVFATHAFVREHNDCFCWTGFDVAFYKAWSVHSRLTCTTMEAAEKIAVERLRKETPDYNRAVIIENATGKEVGRFHRPPYLEHLHMVIREEIA